MKNKPKHKCPYCNHELNLGSLVAKARWDKSTKSDKKKQHDMLTEAKLKKK